MLELKLAEYMALRATGRAGYEPPEGAACPAEAESLTVRWWRATGVANKTEEGWSGEHWAYLRRLGVQYLSPVNVGGE